ncbi:MAG: hypothetical protein VKO64_07575 [Candidatus Sericytochromatia bacterium]|nr:hypothetical protein [Candidatus Sericytochromatia bacterium]
MADMQAHIRGVPSGPAPVAPMHERVAPVRSEPVHHDPRLDRDSMALSGLHADGEVIRTPANTGRPRSLDVAFRAAIRDYIRSGKPFADVEQQLLRVGTPAAEVARIKSEEASGAYRMSRDTFLRSSSSYDITEARKNASSTRVLDRRLDSLRQEAIGAYQGAARAHVLLGGLDPVRRRETALMEQWILAKGFPKDELIIRR